MNNVDQSRAKAKGDNVGRDKVTNINHAAKGKIERLLVNLQEQYESDDETQSLIDELARYHSRRSTDGISGLEDKLAAAGRSDYYEDAIEKKEMFAKLLQRWSLYSSAQIIFSHILAKAETEFSQVIYPQIPEKSEVEINALVLEKIVNPIVEECGDDLMIINHNVAQGMIYWLAEQCFIRWHHDSVAVS